MAERIAVPVKPPAPYEGSEVYLLPALSLEGGAAAELDLMQSQEIADRERATRWLLARWTATYVRYGAVGWDWTRLDEKGRPEPVPFDVEELLADYRVSKEVANKANELYSEAVMGPLLEAAQPPNRAQRRSRTGRTASSTSRHPASIPSASKSSSPADSDGPPLRIAR